MISLNFANLSILANGFLIGGYCYEAVQFIEKVVGIQMLEGLAPSCQTVISLLMTPGWQSWPEMSDKK